MKRISFMSEHTAEYALVRELSTALETRFRHVIPVFFWRTREGSRAAAESMIFHRSRILGVYARRPKIDKAAAHSIFVKVNRELFVASRAGMNYGIPVLIGIPLISRLADYSIACPCCWFRLMPTIDEEEDYSFELSLTNAMPVTALRFGVSGPLSCGELAALVHTESAEMEWVDANVAMSAIRSSSPVPFPYGGGYRPFFMMVTAEEANA